MSAGYVVRLKSKGTFKGTGDGVFGYVNNIDDATVYSSKYDAYRCADYVGSLVEVLPVSVRIEIVDE